jgi:ABC-type nitrate/sulfonate/bicarbonate transport system substrate-binding protein
MMPEETMGPTARRWRRILIAAATVLGALAGAAMAEESVTLAVPGIPPIFASVLPHVAVAEGFDRKFGVSIDLRAFDTGVAAARAVAAGQIDLSVSPTPAVVSMISNARVNLVGIYGLPNPDWLIGSSDPQKTKCGDLRSQAIGVDAVGGARWLALKEMIAPCGFGVDQMHQVALGSNVGQAIVAGQLTFGVLHLDDVPPIESQLHRKIAIVTTLSQVAPVSHYLTIVARADKLRERRDAYVRCLAALIEAGNFMRDSANTEAVVKVAAITGHSDAENRQALDSYNRLELWPNGNDGLQREKIEAVIATQVKEGGIKPDTAPVTYDEFIDRSLWVDAAKLVQAR